MEIDNGDAIPPLLRPPPVRRSAACERANIQLRCVIITILATLIQLFTIDCTRWGFLCDGVAFVVVHGGVQVNVCVCVSAYICFSAFLSILCLMHSRYGYKIPVMAYLSSAHCPQFGRHDISALSDRQVHPFMRVYIACYLLTCLLNNENSVCPLLFHGFRTRFGVSERVRCMNITINNLLCFGSKKTQNCASKTNWYESAEFPLNRILSITDVWKCVYGHGQAAFWQYGQYGIYADFSFHKKRLILTFSPCIKSNSSELFCSRIDRHSTTVDSNNAFAYLFFFDCGLFLFWAKLSTFGRQQQQTRDRKINGAQVNCGWCSVDDVVTPVSSTYMNMIDRNIVQFGYSITCSSKSNSIIKANWD